MTASESDQMRRAFQRRNNEALIKSYWKRFRDGAAERGVSEKTAKRYSSSSIRITCSRRAHALAFGVTAYHMAWLRRHYPTEFYTAIFNAQPMGFWPLETLKQDAKRRGVTIYNPNVNLSEAKCVPQGEDAFRLGLTFVRGLNSESAKTLIENRIWNGPYRSLSDLVSPFGSATRGTREPRQSGSM